MKDHTSEQLPHGVVNDVIIKCSALYSMEFLRIEKKLT